MILYALPLSSYCAKVRICLALKGRTVETREPPGGYRSEAYRAIVPAATIPALVDGDFVLSESDTILEYLNEIFPEPAMLPGDVRARAKARFLGRLHDLHLEPLLRKLFALVGVAPIDAPTRAAIQRKFELLEANLDPAGPFAAGDAPSLADCAFPASLAIVDAFEAVCEWRPEMGPSTRRWRAALAADPAIESVVGPYRETVAAWISAKLDALRSNN